MVAEAEAAAVEVHSDRTARGQDSDGVDEAWYKEAREISKKRVKA